MLPYLSQPILIIHRMKAIPEKVREMHEIMGMDFSEFDRHGTHKNSKDEKKIVIKPILCIFLVM